MRLDKQTAKAIKDGKRILRASMRKDFTWRIQERTQKGRWRNFDKEIHDTCLLCLLAIANQVQTNNGYFTKT